MRRRCCRLRTVASARAIRSSASREAKYVEATSRINARRNARSACTVARYCERAASERLRTRPQKSSRSEEHTSELQSLMRISYAVFCLKKKKQTTNETKSEKQNKKHKQQNRRMTITIEKHN